MYTIDNASMCQEASNVLFGDGTDIIAFEQHERWEGGGHPSGCSRYIYKSHAYFNPLKLDSDDGDGYGEIGCNYSIVGTIFRPCVCASFPVSFFVLTVLAS